jgi:hypothetical protein
MPDDIVPGLDRDRRRSVRGVIRRRLTFRSWRTAHRRGASDTAMGWWPTTTLLGRRSFCRPSGEDCDDDAYEEPEEQDCALVEHR